MAACSKDFLCGDESVAVSAICRSYSYGPNSSERVEKIVIDEKDYYKCSLCVTVCIATTINKSRNRKYCLLRTHPA